MTSKLKISILSIIGVLIVLLLTLGILHANNLTKLFNKQIEEVELKFNITNNDISFKVEENNSEDIVVNIKPKVSFENSLNLQMDVLYNLELNITNNDFIYTDHDNKTPEIVLNIKNPLGEEITEILGFNYAENGFDITGFFGPIKIVENYPLTYKNKAVSHSWDITVTFKYLSLEQTENYNKDFEAHVEVLDYKIKTD